MKLITRQNLLALSILPLASLAMLGEIIQLPKLKALGLASGIAPFTKVFCTANDQATGESYESFNLQFQIHYTSADQLDHTLTLSPTESEKIHGPYNRRNVYGATLAYAPAMTAAQRDQFIHYALVHPGQLARELDIPANAKINAVTITSHDNEKSWKYSNF